MERVLSRKREMCGVVASAGKGLFPAAAAPIASSLLPCWQQLHQPACSPQLQPRSAPPFPMAGPGGSKIEESMKGVSYTILSILCSYSWNTWSTQLFQDTNPMAFVLMVLLIEERERGWAGRTLLIQSHVGGIDYQIRCDSKRKG